MTVSSLDKVLAYVGSTGSTSISFILPGLFYYKISDPESTHHQKLKADDDELSDEEEDDESGGVGTGKPSWRKGLLRKASLGLAIYGVLVMITCLTMNIAFAAAGK
jgi:amino acid permease